MLAWFTLSASSSAISSSLSSASSLKCQVNSTPTVEKNGTILFANDAGSLILDYWGTQTDQSVPEDWHKHVLDVLRSGKSNNYEMECNDQIYSVTLAPVLEESYVNFYYRNITERKKMEDKLKRLAE